MKINGMHIFPILLLSFTSAFSQKYDYQWILPANADETSNILDFNFFPPEIKGENLNINFGLANTSICDSLEGDLAFFSSGTGIYNANGNLLLNGDSLIEVENAPLDFHSIGLAMLTLPAPGAVDIFYVFHLKSIQLGLPLGYRFPEVLFTIIEMQSEGGNGEVVEKNLHLMDSWSFSNSMDAVKHANGRDWWVLVPEWKSAKYYRWLLTPAGIQDTAVQEMDYPLVDSLNRAGWNTFSPDGSKYVDFDIFNGIRIFDFDRCMGLLGNLTLIPPPDTTSGAGPGVVFSPDSRFLYVVSLYTIFQYDLWADDIAASLDTVAVWDGVIDSYGLASNFYIPENGPNGKIYISSGQLRDYLHVIKNPNKKGVACEVVQRGLQFPQRFLVAMPQFPNYRLGPLDSSACDTLGLDNHPLADFNWEVPDTLTPLMAGFTDNSFYEPTDWFWDFGDGDTSTETNPVHLYAASGTYQVCLTVSNQYSSDTVCKQVTVTGTTAVIEVAESYRCKVSPNPASESVYLSCTLPPGKFAEWRLFDALGREVKTITLAGEDTAKEVTLAGLPAGLYFYQLTLENEVLKSGKLVVSQ